MICPCFLVGVVSPLSHYVPIPALLRVLSSYSDVFLVLSPFFKRLYLSYVSMMVFCIIFFFFFFFWGVPKSQVFVLTSPVLLAASPVFVATSPVCMPTCISHSNRGFFRSFCELQLFSPYCHMFVTPRCAVIPILQHISRFVLSLPPPPPSLSLSLSLSLSKVLRHFCPDMLCSFAFLREAQEPMKWLVLSDEHFRVHM